MIYRWKETVYFRFTQTVLLPILVGIPF